MTRCTTFGLTILLALAPAALAVDGTVLINQSTITNGLPNCPTGGHFPIVICQSGSYRLSSNLTVPDSNTGAISIAADNVTIDLNGFSILGPTVCTDGIFFGTSCSPTGFGAHGISSLNSSIVVMNGQIKGMGAVGILLQGVNSRVQNILASSNGSTGIFVGASSIVSSCTVTSNGGNGIASGEQSVLTGNIAKHNGNDGIGAQDGATIRGNSAIGNSAIGIHPACISLIESNVAISNGIDNIRPVWSGCVLVNNAAQ